MKKFLFFITVFFSHPGFGQEIDSAKVLDDVVVKAFAYDKPLIDVPAAVAKITAVDLERFSNTNFLPALNAQPGVRMEERSPGSYRISIRGSTIRSPFGVRNVKVYWNGLPLTDNGGNTYLNLIDFNSVDNLEIIKGPGSSLYGAGTGGVLLLNKGARNKDMFTTTLQAGSYGLLRGQVGYDETFRKLSISINQAHQESDGYRDQSAMERNTESMSSSIFLNKASKLTVNFIHTNIYYQTPGGLTQIQYDTLPTQARLAGGPFPSAVDAKAAVYNNTFFGGITFSGDYGKWDTQTSIFGNTTDFKNPTVRNYEKRNERSIGLRTENHRTGRQSRITIGGEFQTGRSLISVGDNAQGTFVGTGDDVRLPADIMFIFVQYDWTLPKGFFLTAGVSANWLTFQFDTLQTEGYVNISKRSLNTILSPRVALSKKWSSHLSSYVSYSRGYSPPGTAEIYPSIAVYNPTLNPEYGSNYEVGLKGAWPLMELGITFYSLQLNETIVRLNAGADYFTNAGRTSQNGVELYTRFNTRIGLSGWYSHTFNHYRFLDYVQGTDDFSGNQVTGTTPSVIATGLDYKLKGVYTNITINFVDKIPLNDANTAYSDAYTLVGLRLGYRNKSGSGPFEFFGGVDNLLNEKYSLGNDFNAVGARYYNTAAGRNFYLGMQLRVPLLKIM